MSENKEDEFTSDVSTTGFTAYTPSSTSDKTLHEEVKRWRLDDPHEVPCPGNTYIILEHKTQRAINLRSSGDLKLRDMGETTWQDPYSLWHCVERDGYFGFYNQKASKYIGHDGRKSDSNVHARVSHHREWELITPRLSPKGGYSLLCPYYSHALWMINIVGHDDRFVRTVHGDTTWDFVKVS